MNIFVLSKNIKKCARYHNDKHVVKMILEYAQLLSTSLRLADGKRVEVETATKRTKVFYLLKGEKILNNQHAVGGSAYQLTHVNHPCTKWLMESVNNWLWLRELSVELNEEYKRRFKEPGKKKADHRSFLVISSLPVPKNLPSVPMTKFALAMPEECKIGGAVASYREYYLKNKKHLAEWRYPATDPRPLWKKSK